MVWSDGAREGVSRGSAQAGLAALLLTLGCASAPKPVLVKPAVDAADAECARLRQTRLERPIQIQISAQKRGIAAAMAANDRPLARRRARELGQACRTEAQQRIDVAALLRDLADRRGTFDRRRYAQFTGLIQAGDYGNAIVCGEGLLQGIPRRCDGATGASAAGQPYRPTQTVRLARGAASPTVARRRAPQRPAPVAPTRPADTAPIAGPEQVASSDQAATDGAATAEPQTGSAPSRLWFWTAVGVGGAALVGGAVLAGLAKSRHNELEQSCPNCSQSDVDGGKGLAIGADVLFGVGLAAAVGAAVLWFFPPGQPERATMASSSPRRPVVAVTPRGVAAGWTF